MNWVEIFIFYYIISGICTAVRFWYLSKWAPDKEEVEDMIADVTWATGVKRETVKAILYAMALLGGFLILPSEIVEAVWRAVNGKEE